MRSETSAPAQKRFGGLTPSQYADKLAVKSGTVTAELELQPVLKKGDVVRTPAARLALFGRSDLSKPGFDLVSVGEHPDGVAI